MGDAGKKKWQRFEDLATEIQRELSPDAKVTAQDTIRGRKSGAIRKVDISIRQRVGQYDILVIIDCKDYGEPVDVKDVDAFIGMVRDVGANKGALIAANGFTKAAKTLAIEAGIGVHRLVDTGDHDWHSYVHVPVLIHLARARRDLTVQFQTGGRPPGEGPLMLFRSDGTALGSAEELAAARLGEEAKRRGPGVHRDIAIFDAPVFIRWQDRLERVDVRGDLRIGESVAYLGHLDATQFRGLTDEQTGKLAAGSPLIGMHVPEGGVIRRTWQRVDDPSKLAARPEIEIEMFG